MNSIIAFAILIAVAISGCGGARQSPGSKTTEAIIIAPQATIQGRTVTLNGSQSTSYDGGSVAYQWSVIAKPVGSTAEVVNPSVASPTITPDTTGIYSVKLRVTDSKSTVSEAIISLVVTVNYAPSAVAGPPQKVVVGSRVTLDGTACNDQNLDNLSYQWSFVSIPDGSSAQIVPPTDTKPQFVADMVGEYVIRLQVSDGYLQSYSTVTVTAGPAPTDLVVIGNSITFHSPSPSIGWNYSWGMAASEQNKDFAHTLASKMLLPLTVVASRGLELDPLASDADILAAATPVGPGSFVVVELGDNIQLSTLSLSAVQYNKLLDAVKHGSVLVCTGTWWRSDIKDAMLKSSCESHGGTFVAIGDLYNNPLDVELLSLTDLGVKDHPHDWGMDKMSTRVAEAYHSKLSVR